MTEIIKKHVNGLLSTAVDQIMDPDHPGGVVQYVPDVIEEAMENARETFYTNDIEVKKHRMLLIAKITACLLAHPEIADQFPDLDERFACDTNEELEELLECEIRYTVNLNGSANIVEDVALNYLRGAELLISSYFMDCRGMTASIEKMPSFKSALKDLSIEWMGDYSPQTRMVVIILSELLGHASKWVVADQILKIGSENDKKLEDAGKKMRTMVPPDLLQKIKDEQERLKKLQEEPKDNVKEPVMKTQEPESQSGPVECDSLPVNQIEEEPRFEYDYTL